MAARYLLTAAAFLNGSLRRAGEIVEFDGKPSKAMQIIKDATPAPVEGDEPSTDPVETKPPKQAKSEG